MKKNSNAFTLIELLAVIVILGVIMTIAVPAVVNYITSSRKDSFVLVANQFVDAVKTGATTDEYNLPTSLNEVTIIPISSIDLSKGGVTSPFGTKWVKNKSYVAIINGGTEKDPEYIYYFAAQDEKNYAIPLTVITNITKSTVISNAKDTMDITIQSLSSGSEEVSVNQNPPTIIGLPDVTTRGSYTYWLATIYNVE